MRNLSTNLGHLLWFVVAFAGGYHLLQKSRDVRPEILARQRIVTSLEKAILAVRRAAREGRSSPSELCRELLAYGIQARLVQARATVLRLSIRLGPDAFGELEITTGASGRRIATARYAGGLEIRARLAPQGAE